MNYDDIEQALQSGKRATLMADRKAILRKRLAECIAAEESGYRYPSRRRRLRPYAYSIVGVVIAACVVSAIVFTPKAGMNERSSSTMATSESTAAVGSTPAAPTESAASAGSTAAGLKHTSVASTSISDVSISRIQLTSRGGGWAISSRGRLLHTTDGTVMWKDVTPEGVTLPTGVYKSFGPYTTYDFHERNVASFSTSAEPGMIYSTQNGGVTWNHVLLPISEGERVQQIQFVDAQDGFAVVQAAGQDDGTFRLYRTMDGGKSWNVVYASSDGAHVKSNVNTHQPGALEMVNRSTGYRMSSQVPGEGPDWFKTTDGGGTWLAWKPNVPTPSELVDASGAFDVLPQFFGQNGIWTIEYRTAAATYLEVYHTDDGGETWTSTPPLRLPSFEATTDVYFATPTSGWIVGRVSHRLERTTDGGRTWTDIPTSQDLTNVLDLTFRDSLNGYATIATSDGGPQTLIRTTDGGRHWVVAHEKLQQDKE
ncbi:YCF48-related protein [Alicyclobacillus fastidiosus]|uniref:YCF48-related protein n=1 Tax=Alicyclobacillus fastidiosus TaxID=392011 RepID=A0ABY6ZBW9_9BACL|nr:YCF48-related protein [Alicyclobacillus fastidiosus]WAH40344.1 YCF48-related protein [Alicyclobacillus fastidiosus]GMA61728.1 hypothetical protein GCM10025859_21680 [Alicyclobacillus fastidiosus]